MQRPGGAWSYANARGWHNYTISFSQHIKKGGDEMKVEVSTPLPGGGSEEFVELTLIVKDFEESDKLDKLFSYLLRGSSISKAEVTGFTYTSRVVKKYR